MDNTFLGKMSGHRRSHNMILQLNGEPIPGTPRKSFDRDRSPSTVLESTGSTPAGDDDFELWDQSQMLRSDQQATVLGPRTWCKPSCIPISVILILIVLVVLLPLLDHANEKHHSNAKLHSTLPACSDMCSIQLVESIPEGLVYPADSPSFLSTYDVWRNLISIAEKSIDIGSFYWTLRGVDVYNHTSAWQGEKIFQQLLSAGLSKKVKLRIAQSEPTQNNPNHDTEYFVKRKAAEVRSVNFPRLLGGGVLHTKLWIIDERHVYLGSANMDWRSLTQVKELGVVLMNCSCIAKDVSKIFKIYWKLGQPKSEIPSPWPEEFTTKYNLANPVRINFTENFEFHTYLSSSPPPLSAKGRTQDGDAIVDIILHAEKFVYISVMDYIPMQIYTPKVKFWPIIDDALRKAAIENRVTVKLLISWWNHSRSEEDYFLRSLQDVSGSYKGVDIEVRRFIVPWTEDQAKIPFGRVNHNKYMVTDRTAYIGTSNWAGDYFTNTAGIGLVLTDPIHERNESDVTIRSELESVFLRDWNSKYANKLKY